MACSSVRARSHSWTDRPLASPVLHRASPSRSTVVVHHPLTIPSASRAAKLPNCSGQTADAPFCRLYKTFNLVFKSRPRFGGITSGLVGVIGVRLEILRTRAKLSHRTSPWCRWRFDVMLRRCRMQQSSTRIRTKYIELLDDLDERGRRRWAAVEARALGRGGIAAVASATGLSDRTIRTGLARTRRSRAAVRRSPAAKRRRSQGPCGHCSRDCRRRWIG